MNEIRIALVGAGYMAEEHARAFADQPGVRIVGVVGRSPDRAWALATAHGARVFGNIAEMYEQTQADAVVVAVSETAMRVVCEEVFAFPWLCLLEKPVGIDLAEARAIAKLAASRGTKAFVAFNRRSYAATVEALNILGSETGPRLISVLDQQDLASVIESGQPDAVVRNYMFANSIHLVDYFTLFGRGSIERVENTVPWIAERPCHTVAAVHFSSGDVGIYQAVWNGPGPWSVTITDHAVRAELRPLEKLGVQRRSERRLTECPADPIDSMFKPGLHRQAREFCQAIRGGHSALCDIEEGLRSMELCAAIYGLGDQ